MSAPLSIIKKNSNEELRLSLDVFNNYDLLSVRVWFKNADGEMRPGKQGLAVRVQLLPEFAQAVASAMAEAKTRGLL